MPCASVPGNRRHRLRGTPMTEHHPPQPGGSTPERFPEYDSTPPPPRPVPAYNAPAPGQANRNGMAIGALVVGVVGVVLAICFAPVGLVLGVLARRKSPVSGGRGQATSGIVLGAVSVVLAVIVLAFVGSIMNKFGDCTNKATQAEQQACIQGKL